MFKKDIYDMAEMEVIRFSTSDVIRTSIGDESSDVEVGGDDDFD